MADTISTVVVANPENPDAKSDTAAKIDIQSNVANMNLAELDTADAYTFRFWGKILSEDTSATKTTKLIFSNMVEVETFTFTTEWQMFECSFLADAETETFMQFPTGTYIMWHSKMEHGTNATQYSESPLDFKIVTSGTIDVLSDRIELKVQKDKIISSINMSPEEITINAQRININGVTSINDKFKVNLDGSMETIAGKIGGWDINNTTLYNTYTASNKDYTIKLDSNDHIIASIEETKTGTTVTNTRSTELSLGGILAYNGNKTQNTQITLGRQTSFMQSNNIATGIGISYGGNTPIDQSDVVISVDRFIFSHSEGQDETAKACMLAWNWSGKQTRGLYLNSGAYDSTSQSYKEYTIHIGSNGVKLDSEDASRALYLTSGKYIRASNVTATELGYLSGLTKNVETGKQDTLTTEVVPITLTTSINPGATQTLSVSYPSGVNLSKMVGIVGFNTGGTELTVINTYWDNGGLHMMVRNVASTAVTPSGTSLTIIHK